jgi:hypothetical protein
MPAGQRATEGRWDDADLRFGRGGAIGYLAVVSFYFAGGVSRGARMTGFGLLGAIMQVFRPSTLRPPSCRSPRSITVLRTAQTLSRDGSLVWRQRSA